MKNTIHSKLLVGFAIAIAFLLFFTIVTFINMNSLKVDSKKQFESYVILKNLEEIYAATLEIETDQRGYTISGKKSFLYYYDSNIKLINLKINVLASLTSQNRLNKNELSNLKSLLTQKINHCNKVIGVRNDYGIDAALNLIRTEEGRILTAKIRRSILLIEEKERLYLYKSNDMQIKSANFTILIFALLCLIIISILGIVFYYFITDLKEKERISVAIQESKDQLQAILDNTNSLVFIKDLEGKFLFVNRPFEKKVKLSSQFILGYTDFDFYPHETAAKYNASDKETIEKNTAVEFDGMILENEGPTFYHTLKFPLYDNNNVMYGICGITTDVTKKKEIEEKLQATKDQLQSILDNTNSLIAIRDKEGKFLFVNRQYEKLFHTPSDKILGKSVFDFFPKDVAEKIYQHDTEVLKSAQIKEFELEFPVDDELHTSITSKFPLYDSTNQVYAVCAVSTDITERRRAETELQKSNILQSAILNGTEYSIIATDKDGKIIEYNKGSEAMLGYTASEIINRYGPELFIESWRLNSENFTVDGTGYKALVPNEKLDHPVILETEYISKSGVRIPVLLSISVLKDANNVVTGYLGVARDISEQLKAERLVRDAQTQLTHLAKNVPGVIFQYELKSESDRKFVYVSEGSREIFELEPHAIIEDAKVLWKLLNQDDISRFFSNLFEAAKTMKPIEFESMFQLPSGKVRWLKSIAKPEKSETGSLLWNGVILDISEQKNIEFELKQSRERYEIAVQGANDGLWDWNLISNHVYFSARWKSMLGYQEHELQNHLDTFTKLLHPDSVKKVFEIVNDYIAGNLKNYEVELQLLHKKGYYHWVLARGAVLRDNKGKAYRFAGSHTDIMDRKFQEEALRNSEAKFRAMNDASPLGVFVTNPEGYCTYTNIAYQTITGLPAAQLLGDGWLRAIHPDDTSRVSKEWVDSITQKITYESIHRFKRPDGTVVWCKAKAAEMLNNNKVIGYVGTVDDLTEMKNAEEKIIQSTYMINNATDAIIASDLNWVINSYNKAAEKIYGFPPEEILGRVAEEVLVTEFINSNKRNFLLDLKYKGYWSGEVLQKRKDGSLVPILSSLSVNRDNEGNAIGYLAVNRDITERKKREETINKLNVDLELNIAQLELSNRELEAFSYTISHDLRAPLRAIDGFTQILKEDYTDLLDSEAKRLMEVIMSNAKKMGQLIDDLLHFSRLSKQEVIKVEVNMTDMVQKIITDLTATLPPSKVEIILDELPVAFVDSATIKQVWFNLISNSIKYASNKSKIKITIGCKVEKKELIYFVKDNGVGFNMQYYDKLFGVFQRLHGAEFEGTGVGLAIVQRIIQKNDGKVWADSKIDKGATFYFSLPKMLNSQEKLT